MVTGGVAAIAYGEPRLTNDVDVVVQLEPRDAERLVAAFPVSEYYVPPVETIREEAARVAHGHFNIIDSDSALRADVYCVGEDRLGRWALDRRHNVPIGDEPFWLAPVEYVILQKLRYFRDSQASRHLRDVAAIVRISGDNVDHEVLRQWLEDLRLHAEWELALRSE